MPEELKMSIDLVAGFLIEQGNIHVEKARDPNIDPQDKQRILSVAKKAYETVMTRAE